MRNVIKQFGFVVLITLGFGLSACIGGSSSSNSSPAGSPPGGSPPVLDPTLSEQAENTFLSNGLQITVNPSYIQMAQVNPRELKTQNFEFQNGTDQDVLFNFQLFSQRGSFFFIGDNGENFAYQELLVQKQSSVSLKIKFQSESLGTHGGYIQITSASLTGRIRLPLQAIIGGSPSVKLIESKYFCGDDNAPELTVLDFKKVPSQSQKKLSMKVCNVGGEGITVRLPKIVEGTGSISSVFEENQVVVREWTILDRISPSVSRLFPYFNFPLESEFTEPNLVNYSGQIPSGTSAFRVEPKLALDQNFPSQGFIVEGGSYIPFDVFYLPNLSFQPGIGEVTNPVQQEAKVEISSSIGSIDFGVVGATGGREPVLGLSYSPEGSEVWKDIDLSAPNSSIDFGIAPIYPDWIFEGSKTIRLKIKNIGTGTKALKVWPGELNSGYFIYESSGKKLPLSLNVNDEEIIMLKYVPTPPGREVNPNLDLGQLSIQSNASNGKLFRIGLMGKQERKNILSMKQGTKPLNQTYTREQPLNLCAFKISNNDEEVTTKSFSIQNNSHLFHLISEVDASLSVVDRAGRVIPGIRPSVSGLNLRAISQSESQFNLKISFDENFNLEEGTEFLGRIDVHHRYETAIGQLQNDTHTIYYRGYASESGECEGVLPVPDGPVVMSFYRGNLILIKNPGKEPARTPPASKFEVKGDINKEYGSIVARPIPLGTKDIPIHKQLSVYSHKSSVFPDCAVLPMVPYVTELEEGSYLGPGNQCGELTGVRPELQLADSSIAMLADDGFTDVEFTENGETLTGKAGHFKFMQYDVESCDMIMDGSFVTWFMPDGHTVSSWWEEMQTGPQGTKGDFNYYEQYTKAFQIDSYINFHRDVNLPGCSYAAGTLLENDPDALKRCWEAFKEPSNNMTRVNGMVTQRAAFMFTSEGGCYPQDAPEVIDQDSGIDRTLVCEDAPADGGSTYANPDSWKGYGKMELDPNGRYDITIHNLEINAFSVVHAMNTLFAGHGARHINSKMHMTLTTKVIGNDEDGQDPYENVAVGSRGDYAIEDLQLNTADNIVESFWTKPRGLNAQLAVGENGSFDDVPCAPGVRHCRGNYYIRGDNRLMMAGEPMDLDQGGRLMLVSAVSFHGRDSMAPAFARTDSSGKGARTYITFNGCIRELPKDDNGNVIDFEDPVSCFEPHLDPGLGPDGEVLMRELYYDLGLITNSDAFPDAGEEYLSQAWIDFPIYEIDRNRYTDYFRGSSQFKFHDDAQGRKECGFGF